MDTHCLLAAATRTGARRLTFQKVMTPWASNVKTAQCGKTIDDEAKNFLRKSRFRCSLVASHPWLLSGSGIAPAADERQRFNAASCGFRILRHPIKS